MVSFNPPTSLVGADGTLVQAMLSLLSSEPDDDFKEVLPSVLVCPQNKNVPTFQSIWASYKAWISVGG